MLRMMMECRYLFRVLDTAQISYEWVQCRYAVMAATSNSFIVNVSQQYNFVHQDERFARPKTLMLFAIIS